jgi:hypothetical protein
MLCDVVDGWETLTPFEVPAYRFPEHRGEMIVAIRAQLDVDVKVDGNDVFDPGLEVTDRFEPSPETRRNAPCEG